MTHRHPSSSLVFAAFLTLTGSCLADEPTDVPGDCPQVSGRYRVGGSGQVLADVLNVLNVGSLPDQKRIIDLVGAGNGELQVRTSSADSDWRWSQPIFLSEGQHFTCENGRIRFAALPKSWRKADGEESPYGGSSTIEISGGGQTLAISIRFNGSQSADLFAYDSARVSIARPGTGRIFKDSYRWSAVSDEEFESLTKAPEKEPESFPELRKLLDYKMLGDTNLIQLRAASNGVLASFRAPRSKDVIGFEDRLRDALIGYETKQEPVWSDRSFYFEFLIRPGRATFGHPSRPSMMRIEKELRMLGWPIAMVRKISPSDSGYIAAFELSDNFSAEDLVKRLGMLSVMLDNFEAVEKAWNLPEDTTRTVRLRMTLR